MRRSDHPSRPSAITCCRFSALKTLPIPAAGVQPTAQVNVSAPGAALAGFQVSINGRFWVSTEGRRSASRTGCSIIPGTGHAENAPSFKGFHAYSVVLQNLMLLEQYADATRAAWPSIGGAADDR